MANPNNFPNIEGSELISQSWTKLLERDASLRKQFASNEFPEVTAEDVGTPCYREDEQKWYIFTGMGELDTPIWWCPFDEIAAEGVAFQGGSEFPDTTDNVAEALEFLSKKELPNAIILPAESSEYTADGFRVEYPLQKVTSNKNTVHVYLGGVKQSPNSYKLGEGGASVIFNEPPANGELVLLQENATILEYDLMPLEASFVAENETTFKMPLDVVDVRTIQVNVAGTVLQHSQYKVEGRNVILNEPVTGNVQITTIYKGQLSSPAPNTVNTVALQTGAVTGDKIAEGGIVEANLANASVGTMKIADSAVTESKLADGAVTSSKLGEGSVEVKHLSDVTENRLLGAERVAGEMIQTGAVNMDKLGSDVLYRLNELSANANNATNEFPGVVKIATAEELVNNTGGDKVITSDVFNETIKDFDKLGGGRNVGDIFYTTRSDEDLNGAFECDGSVYDSSEYKGEASIGVMLAKGKIPYVSFHEYENIMSLYNNCRCFGWDGGNEFRVPYLKEVYIEAGQAIGAGEFVEESLPNIAGKMIHGADKSSVNGINGPFYSSGQAGGWGNESESAYNIFFDPSRVSKAYKDGAKVKPDSVKYRAMVQIYTGRKELSIADYTNPLRVYTDERLDEINTLADNRVDEVNNVSDNRVQEIIDMGSTNIVYWE
jgi:hypothetical protein